MLAKLLGEADFAALAAAYIAAHDSPYFSIRYYGDALAKFLATREDYAAAPVLAELAQWEWAMTAVFDAADVRRSALTTWRAFRHRSGRNCASVGTRACSASRCGGTYRSFGRR